jgi:hypothetical protein
MFPGRPCGPVLADALDDLGLPLRTDAPRIAADRVIVHNPSFLKFDTHFAPRIVAEEIILVTHENFLRPGGHETHDVARCLDLIDRASVALGKSLAPISPPNRRTVTDWLADHPGQAHWTVRSSGLVQHLRLPAPPPDIRAARPQGAPLPPGDSRSSPTRGRSTSAFPPMPRRT